MSSHVLGLDLGLAAAGAAQVHRDGCVYTQRITTDPLPCWQGHEHCKEHLPDIREVDRRMSRVVNFAKLRLKTSTQLVIVEGPALAAAHGQPDERAGVRWRVIHVLVANDIPFAVLPPTTVKRYIAGNGNADKDLVRAAVNAVWPGKGLGKASYDECDAVALATAGADRLGWPGPWLDGRRATGWLRKGWWPDDLAEQPDPEPAAPRRPVAPPTFREPTR